MGIHDAVRARFQQMKEAAASLPPGYIPATAIPLKDEDGDTQHERLIERVRALDLTQMDFTDRF